MQRALATALACLVLPIAGFDAAGSLGNQFFPAADRDQFKIQVWMAPDTAVTRTADTVLAMEEVIRTQGEVLDVTWVVGASSPPVYYNQIRNQDNNPAYAHDTVLASSPEAAKELVEDLQDRLSDGFPETRVVVRAFGQGPPIPAPVAPEGGRLPRTIYTEHSARLHAELQRLFDLAMTQVPWDYPID